tara:strand:+ start:255 stop:698 length:444 start_codon:yes stop_codon:yes gene_type:complete
LFKVQKKIIYAIEAVIDIALNSGREPVQNEAIAKRQGIPKRYLEQTLQILVKNKILVGSRGPKGGYSLARERRKIRISDIIKSVSNEEKNSSNFTSNLAKKIIIPLIEDITDKCFVKLNCLSVEEVCKIAKEKNIQKKSSKKVDFVI